MFGIHACVAPVGVCVSVIAEGELLLLVLSNHHSEHLSMGSHALGLPLIKQKDIT